MRLKYVRTVMLLCVLMLGWAVAEAAGVPPRVLARGADHSGMVTVRFSPSGDLYASDGFKGRVYRMDPNSGRILETLTEGISSTADIAFGADGTMFWVNAFSGEIYKMTPDRVVTRLALFDRMIDGVAVSADGKLYTASFSDVQATYEIDIDGIEPPKVVAEIGGFDAFDFGPDGALYGPDFQGGSGQIFRVDLSSGTWTVVASGFVNPSSVRFSPAGELHVLDSGGAEMVVVDLATGAKTVVANLPPMGDNFCFSPTGQIFIAFVTDAFVGKVLPNGEVLPLMRPGIASPGGISVRTDDDGNHVLFVGDSFSYRRLDGRSGRVLESVFAGPVVPPFSLSDDGTNLIVTNTMFNHVQVMNPETLATSEFYVDFAIPLNAIRFQGELAVAEYATGNVVRSTDRVPLISGLQVPVGLAADGDDLYVGDWETGGIWKAVEAGLVLDPPRLLAHGLVHPEGMTMDLDGGLLVMETGARRLVKVDTITGAVTLVADGLQAGLPAVNGFAPTGLAVSGVAVADDGTIYCTGDLDNVVYTIPALP